MRRVLLGICRTWVWMQVKEVMDEAGIVGAQAMPKGLRHTFGTYAIMRGVPLHILQRWMGHEDIATTAIYANLVGPEELEIAQRMWRIDKQIDGQGSVACYPSMSP